MNTHQRLTLAAAAVLFFTLTGFRFVDAHSTSDEARSASPSNDEQERSDDDSRRSIYDVSIGPVNTDLLETGSVRQQSNRRFQIALRDAFPLVTYEVAFCSFATGETGCLPLGKINTAGGGVGDAVLRFPQRGVFAGVFIFSRDGQIHYMTGMTKPGRADFFINQELERVAAVRGRLGPGFTAGTDRLGRGSVAIAFSGVTEAFEMNVSLRRAARNATYSVLFCKFPLGDSDCSFITQLGTDIHGNASLATPPLRGDYYGVFVFTRVVDSQELAEYVTAFRVK